MAVTLRKGKQQVTSENPTLITQLKAEGWKVEQPKAGLPKPLVKGDDK